MSNQSTVVSAKTIQRYFRTPNGLVRAVDHVKLEVHKSQRVAIVGESGSGKSTLGRIVAGIDQPTAGELSLWGKRLSEYTRGQAKELRRRVGVVFQDPFTSLNPSLPIWKIVAEPLAIHRRGSGQERRSRSLELLDSVGLDASLAGVRPSALSGGQRQRVAIARSIALNPDLLVLDEPVSALDVSVQAQVLNLIQDLYEEIQFAALVISHDLPVVRQIVDYVVVMYLGRLIEEGPVDQIFEAAQHPYTITLLSSAMDLEDRLRPARIAVVGDPPSPINPPPGCPFHPRCFRATALCAREAPEVEESDGRRVACHFPGPVSHEGRSPVSQELLQVEVRTKEASKWAMRNTVDGTR